MIDLANEVIRETLRHDSQLKLMSVRTLEDTRETIEKARRFILDADMSEMLGHISTAPYELNRKNAGKVLSSQRRSSRLPFDRMFVQYDGRAFRRGLLAGAKDKKDLWGKHLLDESEGIIDPVGWLMERMRTEDNKREIVKVTEYMMLEDTKRVGTLPFAWCWSTDDSALDELNMQSSYGTRHEADIQAAQLAHGVTGYHDHSMAIVYLNRGGKKALPRELVVDVVGEDSTIMFQTHYMVAEAGGAMRYMFAFLNLLNEVPVSYERARRTQAYLANGKRRTAVDHQVIRLVLPNRTITYREYARQLSRGVIKRAAHPVRGHWRVYGPRYCGDHEQHDWGPTDASGHADCNRCSTSRTWINNYRTGVHERTEAIAKMYSVGARRGV